MSWDMTSVVEHRIEIAGHATRALEVDGGGPGIVLLHGWSDSADTWRPLLAQLGARGRRAIAVDLPGFGEATRLHDGAVLPQLDAFALDLVESWADKEPVVVAGTSLGGCVALRLAEHPGNVRLVGVVPVAPDGLELPSWFDPIEEDPIVRRLLSIPVPVPGILVRRARSSAYRPVHLPGPERHAARRRGRLQPRRRDARGPRRAARQQPRAGPGALARPVRPDRHPLPRAARVGRPRPDAPAQRRADRDGLAADDQVELIEGAGRRPQLEATGRLLELLLPFGT